MILTRLRLACFLALLPALAGAQTLTGAAEWTASSGGETNNGVESTNNSFWQNYTLGFDSFAVDPRLVKYSAGLNFGTDRTTFGSAEDVRQGRQRGVGYHVTAGIFPDRPFPLTIQLSRDRASLSGDATSTSLIQGGIVVPAGQVAPDFLTRNGSLSVNWRLQVEGLPRVELGYQSTDTEVDGGGYNVGQQNGQLHALVSKDTLRTRQAFRYQRSSFGSLASDQFNQHLNELEYSFGGVIGPRTHVSAHAGTRSSFSLFEAPAQVVDAGTGVAQPAAPGKSDTKYAMSGVTFDPSRLLSLGLNANVDEMQTAGIPTTSQLASTTARFGPVSGLSVNGTAGYGARSQFVADELVSVLTRNVLVATSYHNRVRWLDGSVAASRGVGQNTADDGRLGAVETWSGDAALSASISKLSISTGFDRLHGADAILDYGNYDIQRVHASLQFVASRASLMGNWDLSVFERGRDVSFSKGQQAAYSASLAYSIGKYSQISANGGGFDSRTTQGNGRTFYGGGGYQFSFGRVGLSASLREESTTATANSLGQWNLFGFARAEYTRRQFGFALEYRRIDQRLQTVQLPTETQISGRQLNLRISRKFGVRL